MGSTTLTSIETQLHNEDHTDLNGDCLQIQREQFLKLATTGQAAYLRGMPRHGWAIS